MSSGRSEAARILRAAWTLHGPSRDGSFEVLEGGGVLSVGARVERVLRSDAELLRSASHLGVRVRPVEGCLLPGLVNAHAHLELSGLAGRLPRGGDFVDWVRAVVAALAASTAGERAAATEEGARRLLASGTTTVGDVDSTGAHTGPLPVRRVVFREALDARDPARTAEALRRLRRALPARSLRTEGVAPHAPHTTSHALARELARIARTRRAPVSVHWAESEAEVRWLAGGGGPFAELLGTPPGRGGLALLADAGLLGRRTCLVHANHPDRGDRALVAASGATLVHCPGTHAYFGRAPFPWSSWTRAGVPVALGTDSLASNEALDLRRELALLRASQPRLGARAAFLAVTTHAARALDLPAVGRLARGSAADLVALRFASARPDDFLEELTRGGGAVTGVWVAGRRVALDPL